MTELIAFQTPQRGVNSRKGLDLGGVSSSGFGTVLIHRPDTWPDTAEAPSPAPSPSPKPSQKGTGPATPRVVLDVSARDAQAKLEPYNPIGYLEDPTASEVGPSGQTRRANPGAHIGAHIKLEGENLQVKPFCA